MSHEQLWAPWRLGYIVGPKSLPAEQGADEADAATLLPGADPGCFLCRGAADTELRRNLVVWRRRHSLVVLNRYPYNNGHLLVAPLEHRAALTDLASETQLELVETLGRLTTLLAEKLNAEGFNIGLNLGRVAGAGVPGHLHWHLVPRWPGDTNFMPVLGDTSVISQSLDALYDLLSPALANQS